MAQNGPGPFNGPVSIPSSRQWYTDKHAYANACARNPTQVEVVDMRTRAPEPIEMEKPVYEMDTGEESHIRDATSSLLKESSVNRPVHVSFMHVARHAYKRVCWCLHLLLNTIKLQFDICAMFEHVCVRAVVFARVRACIHVRVYA